MDTVDVCEGWTNDPFNLKVDGDVVYGLGVHDMKGGLVAILQALRNFGSIKIRVKVAFGVDEENVSKGADILVKSGWLNDVDFAIVPETATSKKNDLGPHMITLGRRGRVAIKIIVIGKSAHGALPHLGINSIEDAARIVLALDNLQLIEHEKLGTGSVCPLAIKSEVKSLSVPDRAEIVVDRHLVPPETTELVLRQVTEMIEGLNLRSKVEVSLVKRDTPFCMPYLTEVNHPFVQMISEIMREKYEVVYNYGASVADENYFSSRLNIPVVVIGPRGGNDHAANEWVSLSSIDELAEIFREFLNRIESGNSEGVC